MTAPARKTFRDHTEPAAGEQPAERKNLFPCQANGCRMPGTIYPNNQRQGVCAWHHGANPLDWPKITQVLTDWSAITEEIVRGRVELCGDAKNNPKALAALFSLAIERVRPAIDGGWGTEFEPRTGEHYEDWVRRMEGFMLSQVRQAVGAGQ